MIDRSGCFPMPVNTAVYRGEEYPGREGEMSFRPVLPSRFFPRFQSSLCFHFSLNASLSCWYRKMFFQFTRSANFSINGSLSV